MTFDQLLECRYLIRAGLDRQSPIIGDLGGVCQVRYASGTLHERTLRNRVTI